MVEIAKNATFGEKYDPAMNITTQDAATAYFKACVQHTMSFGKTEEEAEEIERVNLGYWAGYYGLETRLRVERLFGCVHPFFGAAKDGVPTPAEAFKMGQNLASGSANDK